MAKIKPPFCDRIKDLPQYHGYGEGTGLIDLPANVRVEYYPFSLVPHRSKIYDFSVWHPFLKGPWMLGA